jgi:CO/xanthine dehydrogenase Mo-binding subunit
LGRPVKLVLTRIEELQAANPAPAMRVRVRLGLKRDGSFTALEARIITDSGCYPFSVLGLTSMLIGSIYRFPNLFIHGTEVLTFKPSAGAYRLQRADRGPAIESATDEAAASTPTLEVRLHNGAQPRPRVGTEAVAGIACTSLDGPRDPSCLATATRPVPGAAWHCPAGGPAAPSRPPRLHAQP